MFQQLLLALDDSPAGPVSVSFATAKAREYGSSVHVLHVNPFVVGGRGLTVLSQMEAAALVDEAVDDLRRSGVHASGSVVRGTCFDVATRIVESARTWSADAIVLGTHGRRRLLPGPGRGIRERVMTSSTLPVVVAPAPLKVPRTVRTGVDSPSPQDDHTGTSG